MPGGQTHGTGSAQVERLPVLPQRGAPGQRVPWPSTLQLRYVRGRAHDQAQGPAPATQEKAAALKTSIVS